MAKQIGAIEKAKSNHFFRNIEELKNKTTSQSAEIIADFYSKISNEYKPIELDQLPSYLPSKLPPQLEEFDVYQRILKMKNTRSIYPIDVPNKLIKEFAHVLAAPLTNIFNASLMEQIYPSPWKKELVTPVPKVTECTSLTQLRKIACTSQFNKAYEFFIKQWIIEDVYPNLDDCQFGDQAGTGTEHLLVRFVDRVLQLLDSREGKQAVISASIDWRVAFDRLSPQICASKFIMLGLRSELVTLLISYMSDREMSVMWQDTVSSPRRLVGGSGQGCLLAGPQYLVGSCDVADSIPKDDKYRYFDDLQLTEVVTLSGLLISYDFWNHVASDVAIDQLFLKPSDTNIQNHLDNLQKWTADNQCMINATKSDFIIFSRSQDNFTTRLSINNETLNRVNSICLLGLWISEDMSWDLNTREVCKKAYMRTSMLSKLKYVGVQREDLLLIYKLFIRSCLEYCSIVYHSSLTIQQSNSMERVQRVCLRLILANEYIDYEQALRSSNLSKVSQCRENRALSFAHKALKHFKHK